MTDDTSTGEDEIDDVPSEADVVYALDDDERPSEAVVRTVARATDTEVLDLDALCDAIDPEHLNEITTGLRNGDAPGASSITFTFNGCQVSVTQDTIDVRVGAE